ncbi:ABC transporter ATP-binding protein [Ottowia cancrivicina]|uniref:ABC transporter ATP-binding protein n=1 Tax=Ottowia cancrivicina TaxID=3040346 RepID=A0AAW6RM10_9BURK|nr:ABC transporter ATP-binding protein [Ottowia sp. 10c7w1]MDG9698967.1 ABC transporter ATP-binding protein [Ottowia sp. 10c7w1]
MNGGAGAADAVVLRACGLGKEYRLYDSPRQRLKALLTGRAQHRSHWALRDVSFELRRGQCIGVIGDNGAGKSSLLKLLAGTLQPTQGRIERQGRITAILELGAGFHPDFSGRDNLYFGGSMIGISHEEMARLEPEIVAFAGLGEAMSRPVKTYSSGMAVRLAFALVTAVQPDVLIIDEALAVGDQHFQKKCVERITAFKKNGCTILFCSHSPYHIRTLCDVALWLDGGQVKEFGPTEPVLGAYEMHTRLRNAPPEEAEAAKAPAKAVEGNAADAPSAGSAPPASPYPPPQPDASARIISVDIANLGEGEPPLLQGRDLVATITVRGHGQERPNVGFMIEQSRGVGITSLATHEEGAAPQPLGDGLWRSVLTFPDLPLHSGEYVVSAFLFDASGLVVYEQWFQFLHFRFVTPTLMPGLVRLPHRWE